MTAIILLQDALTSVEAFEFSAVAGPGSRTGWVGAGKGKLTIRQEGADILLFESGTFTLEGQTRSAPMRNVYRWRVGKSRISLFHERRGADAAVALFDLIADGEQRLVSASAHQCAADAYRAEITLVGAGFDLEWRIEGPKKDEFLHYRYR